MEVKGGQEPPSGGRSGDNARRMSPGAWERAAQLSAACQEAILAYENALAQQQLLEAGGVYQDEDALFTEARRRTEVFRVKAYAAEQAKSASLKAALSKPQRLSISTNKKGASQLDWN